VPRTKGRKFWSAEVEEVKEMSASPKVQNSVDPGNAQVIVHYATQKGKSQKGIKIFKSLQSLNRCNI
jgi:hypothetical protein